MKIIAIGDIHGRTVWKDIVEKEKDADKIVFVGDYVDTHHRISPSQQVKNFTDILEYKKKNEDKVVLLIGNHDYHYLPKIVSWGIRYSGFQGSLIPQISPVLMDAVKNGIIQTIYVHDNIIFVHAGLSKSWCNNNHVDLDNLEEYINNYFLHNTGKFDFQFDLNEDRGWCDPYGDNMWQSPLWIRPASLLKDRLDNYIQVVGHTQMKEIDLSLPIKFIDILGTKDQYLIYENDKFKIGEL